MRGASGSARFGSMSGMPCQNNCRRESSAFVLLCNHSLNSPWLRSSSATMALMCSITHLAFLLSFNRTGDLSYQIDWNAKSR